MMMLLSLCRRVAREAEGDVEPKIDELKRCEMNVAGSISAGRSYSEPIWVIGGVSELVGEYLERYWEPILLVAIGIDLKRQVKLLSIQNSAFHG